MRYFLSFLSHKTLLHQPFAHKFFTELFLVLTGILAFLVAVGIEIS